MMGTKTDAIWLVTRVMLSVCLSASKGQEGTVNFSHDVLFLGERFASEKYNGSYGYAYYGLRYASCKRFEASTGNYDFMYLHNASRPKLGPICPQGFLTGFPNITEKVVDEDCLYLDIYIPPILRNAIERFPILLWIHGGGFQVGSKDGFNGSSLADNTRTIVVTINYRLSVFGFLGTGDDTARGNYGLGDCKQALKWVKAHIQKFGGKEDAITLIGESSGASMISAMLLDSSVRNDVFAAVMFSGSGLTDYSYIHNPVSNAISLGKAVGCQASTTESLIVCLKGRPVDQLSKGTLVVPPENPIVVSWAFVVDNEHIPNVPLKVVQNSSTSGFQKPNLVISYLREDVSILLAATNPELFDSSKPLALATLRNIVAKQFLPVGDKIPCAVSNYALADRVLSHYNISDIDDREAVIWKFFHLATESMLAYPSTKEAAIYSERGDSTVSVQLVRISYDSHYNGLGAFHMMDLPYIFGPQLLMPNQSYDPRLASSIRGMLRQVAYNGRMDGPVFSQSGQYSELGQSAQWSVGDYNHLEMVNFWDQIASAPCSTGVYGTSYQ